MAHQSTSDDFDWVNAQSQCTARRFFERLKTGVQTDVERRNALPATAERVTFEFYEDDDGSFEVTRALSSTFGSKGTAVVRFQRIGRRIEVSGEDIDIQFTAIASLDPEGHCRVVVGEALYSEWEFRRMSLEPLFFQDELEDHVDE